MYFAALEGLKLKKLLPSTPIKIEFCILYQFLGILVGKCFYPLFASPWKNLWFIYLLLQVKLTQLIPCPFHSIGNAKNGMLPRQSDGQHSSLDGVCMLLAFV